MSVSLNATDPGGAKRAAAYDAAKPLGKGGAGYVFRDDAAPKYALKLYHEALDARLNIATAIPPSISMHHLRIVAMLKHPPSDQVYQPAPDTTIPWSRRPPPVVQIAWPQQMLHDGRGQFVGFSMGIVDFDTSVPIESLFEVATRKEIAQKFALPGGHQSIDYTYRLTVCQNLASLVQRIHAAGHAICDLNPQNVRIYVKRGLACLIDCDGFRIEAGGKVFPCLMMLDEIAAPEVLRGKGGFEPAIADKHQDLFALGLLIFRMLNDGKTPYHVVARTSKVVVPGTIPERIRAELYGYGSKPHSLVKPAPNSLHEAWPNGLRSFFDRCFQPGGNARLRPSALEWQVLLEELRKRSSTCQQHGGGTKLDGKTCVYCARDRLATQPAPNPTPVPGPQKSVPPGKGGATGTQPTSLVSRRQRLMAVAIVACAAIGLANWNNAPRVFTPAGSDPPLGPTAQNTRQPTQDSRLTPSSKPNRERPSTASAGPVIVKPAEKPGYTQPAASKASPLEIASLQEQLNALKINRGAASGQIDDATRRALAGLGLAISHQPDTAELRALSLRLRLALGRQAANAANAERALMSRRFAPAAFAALDEEDLRTVAYATGFALSNTGSGERYVHKAFQSKGAQIELVMKPDPGNGCRKFDMSISKFDQAWTVYGVRACGSSDRWTLEE